MRYNYRDLIGWYNDGHITAMELRNSVIQLMTDDNVAEVYAAIPDHLKEMVADQIYLNPDTLKTVRIGSYIIRGEAGREAIRKEWAEEDRKYREGIEALRKHLGRLPA